MPILVQGMAKPTGDRFLIKSNAGYVARGALALGLHHAKSTTFFIQTGQLVEEISRLSADSGVKWTLSDGFKEAYLHGADELELVRSGLDDTMRESYMKMQEVWFGDDRVDDLRTAAYVVAIRRIANVYGSLGL